jgi:hypothetical protein
VALDRELDRIAGLREIRRTGTTRQLAVGTLACPDCDAPTLPDLRPMAPADALTCPFCGHAGRLRDFLSLGEPTRPTRVVVTVSGLPARR